MRRTIAQGPSTSPITIEGMTVAQLRAALAHLPDDLVVVVALDGGPEILGYAGEMSLREAFGSGAEPFDLDQRVAVLSRRAPAP